MTSEGVATCRCLARARGPLDDVLWMAPADEAGAEAIRDVAERPAVDVRWHGPLLHATGDDLGTFLIDAVEVLGPAARRTPALFAHGRLTAAQAMTALTSAPSLVVLAARERHSDLLTLLEDEGAFAAAYQPIVDLRTGGVVGQEALLRAVTDAGEVLPGRLFAAAEEAGWTHRLDRIGRITAIEGAAGWLGEQALHVNFLPTSIYRPQVCLASTEAAARSAGVPLHRIVFEVVESERVEDHDHLRRIMDHYRSLGCRVALDDAGAGYASLSLLAALEPDVVKIDGALVRRLPERAAVAVVRGLTGTAHELGATVVGECVETAEQADVLRDLGVDQGQGHLFGRPVRRDAAPDRLMAAAT